MDSDVLADELHRHRSAARVWHVGELLRRGELLERHRDDLVLLLGAGAAHLEGLVAGGFDRVDIVLRRLVGRLRIHPQHELVQRQHRHGGQVRPAEGHAGGVGRGKEVRQRDDDVVGVAGRLLDLEKAFRSGSATLVQGDERLFHQVVLGDHALKEARHLVGAAAGAGGDDELHRLGGFPASCSICGHQEYGGDRQQHRKWSISGRRPRAQFYAVHIFLPNRRSLFNGLSLHHRRLSTAALRG